MEEIETPEFDDYEMNYPPKLSFEELNLHLRNTPYHILKTRSDILKTFYFYSKDSKYFQITYFRKETHENHPASLLVADNPFYPRKGQQNKIFWDKTAEPAGSERRFPRFDFAAGE
jgi:hypothetical protein